MKNNGIKLPKIHVMAKRIVKITTRKLTIIVTVVRNLWVKSLPFLFYYVCVYMYFNETPVLILCMIPVGSNRICVQSSQFLIPICLYNIKEEEK
jgi:hypothetical protein